MRKKKILSKVVTATLAVCMTGSTIFSSVAPLNVKAADMEDARWNEIQSIVSRYYGEWRNPNFDKNKVINIRMPNSAILGNGDVGVTSYGDADTKSFIISKGDHWSYNGNPIPLGGVTIKKQEQAEVPVEGENIAPKYKTVSVSSSHPDFDPKNAVSGEIVDNPSGYGWVSQCPWQTGQQDFWMTLEYDNPVTIGRYVLKSDSAVPSRSGNVENNTSDFRIEVSDTGADGTWTVVDTVTGNKDAVVDRNLAEAATGKFVRLYITKATQGNTTDSQKNPRARIAQFELYADAASESPAAEKAAAVPFYEKQDILNAEIQTKQDIEGTATSMKTWLAADDNIMVVELKSDSDEDAQMQVDVGAMSHMDKKNYTIENDDNSVTVSRRTGYWWWVAGPDAYMSEAAMSTRIIGADQVEVDSDSETALGNLKFTLPAGEKVYIVTTVGGGGKTYNKDEVLNPGMKVPADEAKELLSTVTGTDKISDINEDRQEWWKDFWSASYVDFGTSDANLNTIQKYYYGAQYILGSSTKEGEIAPGIFGIWHTDDRANWNSDYHLNYNFISTFYGTNSSNRPELSLPGVEALLSYMPVGESAAASTATLNKIDTQFVQDKVRRGQIDSQKGIEDALLYPVGIGPWGITTDPAYHNEALDAAYNAYHMLQYYEYTLDDGFIDEGTYEYLRKTANFYKVWLEKEDSTTNPDGYEYVLYAGYNEGSWARNPAVELASIKNVLKNLIKYSEELDRDAEERKVWEDMYTHLAPQPTVEVTLRSGKKVNALALAERERKGGTWVDMTSPIPADGNAIPLDAMIPGCLYNYFSSEEDLQLVRDTIEVFDERGAWGQINNFPRLFTEAVKSRYPVNAVVNKLAQTINFRMVENLRIDDNNHGVEKSGATEAINSMMLISEENMVKLFPNWYADKDAKFSQLRAKGAFTVSAEYDGAAQEAKNVSVTSEKGKTMTLVSPWAEGAHVLDSEGNIVKVTTGTVPNWEDTENMTITFDTKAGETYTVEKGLVDDGEEEVDKEWLSALIDYAHSQQEQEEYQYLVPAVKVPFEKAVEEAVAVNNNAKATQAEVDAAYDKLLDMVHYLGFTGNSDSLKVLADSARGLNPDLFTEETWAVLEDALAKADAVLANENALQAEIDVARDVLQDAIDGLVRIPVDKDALKKLIDKSQKYVDKIDQYTDGTAKIFTDVLAEAVATYENADASQKDVDAAYAALQNAIFQLRLKPNKDKLDDLIKAAEKVDTSKYTEESAAAFKAALDDAKAVFADSEATKEEVKAAEKALKDAQKNLVAKTDTDTDKKGNDKVASNDGNNNTNSGAKSQPKTGDAATVWTMLLGCMAAVVAAGTVVIRRKR